MLNTQVLKGYSVMGRIRFERLMRVVRHPRFEFMGRRLLSELRRRSFSDLRMGPRTGWVRFDTTSFSLAEQPFRLVRALAEKWAAEESPERHLKRQYPINMLLPSDLRDHPTILEFALRDEFLLAASEYLGQVPRLVSIGVLRSPANGSVYWRAPGSQDYHYDPRDSREVKIFINLTSVTHENGPTHFLPADACERFNAKVGYRRTKIPDDVVYSVCSRDEVLDSRGDEGMGIMVDTSRCLHYGSRNNSSERWLLVISYTRPNCARPGKCVALDPVREELARRHYADDPIRNYALLAGFSKGL